MPYTPLARWLVFPWDQAAKRGEVVAPAGASAPRAIENARYGSCLASSLLWCDLQLDGATRSRPGSLAAHRVVYEAACNLWLLIERYDGLTPDDFMLGEIPAPAGAAAGPAAPAGAAAGPAAAGPAAAPAAPAGAGGSTLVRTAEAFRSGMRAAMPRTHSIATDADITPPGGDRSSLSTVIGHFLDYVGRPAFAPFVFAYVQGGSAHAVAFTLDDRFMYFFDPNSGEYCVDRREVPHFIEAWLACSARAFREADARLGRSYVIAVRRTSR